MFTKQQMSALRGFAEEDFPTYTGGVNDKRVMLKVGSLRTVSREEAGKTRRQYLSLRRPITLHESAGGVKVTITSLDLLCYRHETVVCFRLAFFCAFPLRGISGCPDMKSGESAGKCFPVFSLCSADTFDEGNGLSSPTSCT